MKNFFAEGLRRGPSTKSGFAKCSKFGSRQSLKPSVEDAFPVMPVPSSELLIQTTGTSGPIFTFANSSL